MLIPDVPEDRVDQVKSAIEALGFAWKATEVRTGLVACTGNFGCKFSSADTKRHAMAIADHLDARIELDVPINIHVTGCPNSCAQHYIGDVGLLGTKVAVEDDMVEGYHLFLGRRLRARSGHRPRDLPRGEGRGRTHRDRADAPRLPRLATRPRRDLPRLHQALFH